MTLDESCRSPMPARPVTMVRPGRAMAVALVALVLAGCNDDGRDMRAPTPDQTLSIITTTMAPSTSLPAPGATDTAGAMGDGGAVLAPGFEVTLPWEDGGTIPNRHTCAGAGVSPTIAWTGAPAGTVEMAIVVRAPTGSVHLVVAGVPPTPPRLDEGARLGRMIPGVNDLGDLGWTAPCPAPGERVLLTVEVRAVAQQIEVQRGDPAAVMMAAIDAATIATAVGTGIIVG